MKILYIDIDSLRPDHLGCYGYHRDTSPTIDRLAANGIRFDNVYASDAPCLPSRTALFSGRTGFRTGVVGHGGTSAQPYIEGPSRGFHDLFGVTGWMNALRQAGHYTATISLRDALNPDTIRAYNKRATGEKFLIDPSR